jgi:hypothetical protein
MSARRPTPEQQANVAAFRTGDHLVLQAGAGTGTITLTLLAGSTGSGAATSRSTSRSPLRRGASLPRTSSAGQRTAWRSPPSATATSSGWSGMAAAKLASSLGITMEVRIGDRRLTTPAPCYAAQQTVTLCCYSADDILGRQHVLWLKAAANFTKPRGKKVSPPAMARPLLETPEAATTSTLLDAPGWMSSAGAARRPGYPTARLRPRRIAAVRSGSASTARRPAAA